MVSILLLHFKRSTIQWSPFYFFILTFPPLRSTKQWSPFYFLIYTFPPPPAPHYTMFSILFLYLLCPPALHHTMVSILLLDFNFPLPCAPPYNGLHSTSSFKLPPPAVLRSTRQWFPFCFFISTYLPALHQTMVSILLLHFNFPSHCAPTYSGLHSTSSFKFSPHPALHHTMVSFFDSVFTLPTCAPPYNGLHSTSSF